MLKGNQSNKTVSRLKLSMNYPSRSQQKTNLDVFKYKVVHNILPTNSNLYKITLRTSASCDRCSHPHKNLFHLLYECPSIHVFWQRVISWWNERRSENVTLSALDTSCYTAISLNQIFFNPQSLCYYCKISHLSLMVK